MTDCPRLIRCTFFNEQMDRMPSLTNLLKKQYCQGEFTTCARYIVLENLGQEKVPDDLFPNHEDRAKSLIGKR